MKNQLVYFEKMGDRRVRTTKNGLLVLIGMGEMTVSMEVLGYQRLRLAIIEVPREPGYPLYS